MFHVSRKDLGATVTLIPSVPKNRSDSECEQTPRVCFAPTVGQCLIGMVGYGVSREVSYAGAFMYLMFHNHCPTVYTTDEVLHEPEWVSDYHITHEEWSLQPITVKRVGYVDVHTLLRKREAVIVAEPVHVDDFKQELNMWLTPLDRELLSLALASQQN